ncbi:MAG: hypothetical protein C5B50_08485 [Verrucomicrobia bacterium]|nr:MAG: hypothetical protein C5B50_08485 [Verrucomicrobiota bacterium]
MVSKAEEIYHKVQALPDTTQRAVLQMVESLAGNGTQAGAHPGGRLAQEFDRLVEIWRRETGYFSFMSQRALHPAYQRIIGMGWALVPLLLLELQRQPDHFLWALEAITGEKPAGGMDTLQSAAGAWLEWGRERSLVRQRSQLG